MYHLWWVWLIIGILIVAAIAWLIWYYWKAPKSEPLEPPIQPIDPSTPAMGQGMMMGRAVDMHKYGVGEDGRLHSVEEPCSSGLHHQDGSYTSSNVLYPGSYVMPNHYMTRGYSTNWGLGYGPIGDGSYGAGLSKSQVAKHPGLKGLVHQPASLGKWYQEHSTPQGPLIGHGSGQATFGNKGYWEGFSNPVQYP